MQSSAIERIFSASSSLIAFLVSFSLHTALCIGCALLLVGGIGTGDGGGGISIVSSTNGESPSLESMGMGDSETISSGWEEPMEMPLESPVQISMLTEENFQNLASHSSNNASLGVDEFRASLAASSSGQGGGAGVGEGSGGSGGSNGSATFFGAKAAGERFVFVVDSSTSMIGPRWEALCYELENVLRSLDESQEFFIISFDEGPHPIFGDFPPNNKFLNPTKESIQRVRSWLANVTPIPSTRPAQSIAMALSMNPDAIFLLSDGEIMDDTIQELRIYNSKQAKNRYYKPIPIHTILLHSQAGYFALEVIANENHGTFTPVRL